MSPRLILAVMIAVFTAVPAHAESFKSWAARGAREDRENDAKAALSSYSNALFMWSDDDGNAGKAKVLCARAGLREKEGDDAGALGDLSDCLALDKKNANGFHRRGALLLRTGKTSASIGDFYRAVALNIGFGPAYADRARAYEIMDEQGFAREDYRRACELGVKASCAKAKSLAPASQKKVPTEPEVSASEEATQDEAVPEAVKKPALSYRPKFEDCLKALDACVEAGNAFGTCVRAAPNCGIKPVKGCCPAACLKAYQKSINRDRSEAASYREHFAPNARCGRSR